MEILFETRGAVLVVTFNRPQEGNALTPSMAKAMCEKFKSISENRAVRAVLLRGNGGLFMDGHDLKAYNGDANALQEHNFQKVQFFYGLVRELRAMERPVIAAIDGRVSGAGFSLMLASDLVMAADNAVFNTGFISHGIVPDTGATYFLSRKVGSGRAAELFMLSEDFSAEAAKNYGLVTKIVALENLQAEAMAFTEKLAAGPTRAYAAAKKLIDKAFEEDLNAHLSLESIACNASIKTFDFREAIKAYFTKREPKFTGS